MFLKRSNMNKILKKYYAIMEKPEEHRSKWALGLAIASTALIFISFSFYKGYLGFGGGGVASKNQVANVVSAESAPSPIQNTKETFTNAFGEINKKYQEFKDSVSSVLVPFVTGIEVYERK